MTVTTSANGNVSAATASAACSSPEYQSRVSITSAIAMPRDTVN